MSQTPALFPPIHSQATIPVSRARCGRSLIRDAARVLILGMAAVPVLMLLNSEFVGDAAGQPPQDKQQQVARQPSVTDAEIEAAIQRGVKFLRQNRADAKGSGETSLALYALLKAGESPEDPLIEKLIATVVAKVNEQGVYKPVVTGGGLYEAGLDMMILESADSVRYRPQMQAILNLIVSSQWERGYWDYLGVPAHEAKGDTSVTQYAILGMWSASRAGLSVPGQSWDRAAAWFLEKQGKDGSFVYRPETSPVSRDGMTVAGTTSLLIIRSQLYPNASLDSQQKNAEQAAKAAPKLKFGVLKEVNLDQPETAKPESKAVATRYAPRVGSALILNAAVAGMNLVHRSFHVGYVEPFPYYHFYGVERLGAIADVDQIGKFDWYRDLAGFLVPRQCSDGGWRVESGQFDPAKREPSARGNVIDTSFSVLFLARATARTLNKPLKAVARYGSGLLVGGRGLPDKLNQVEVKDGKVTTQQMEGTIDELLGELEKDRTLNVASAQTALVEKIELGDRQALITQKSRLVKLVNNPRAEVRRTAAWALGRTGDLTVAPLLIELLDDPDLDVAVEARNSLCWISRKPRGFGLPETPTGGLPETATDAERQAATTKWRQQSSAHWKKWYLAIRPYSERNDLSPLAPKPSR